MARNWTKRIKIGEDAMQVHARGTSHRPKSHVKYHSYRFEDYQIDSVWNNSSSCVQEYHRTNL